MAGTLFSNPGSGGDDAPGPDELAAALGPFDIEVEALEDPSELGDRVEAALRTGRRPIGVSGGDGSVRSVAEVLTGPDRRDVPLLVVPGGTRNHFAKEIGLETLDRSVEAVRAGAVRTVSIGRVNDRVFLNNASLGLYPDLVRRRSKHQRVVRSKTVAGVFAAVTLLRDGSPVRVRAGDTDVSTWLLFVGNGCYGDGFTDLVERESIDSGVLDIRLVRADRRLARLRVAVALVLGRLDRTPLVISARTSDLTVDLPTPTVDVALDGEVVTLDTPLTFTCEARGLAVVAPPGA